METKEKGVKTAIAGSHIIPSNLYVLKHKDLDVAMVQVDISKLDGFAEEVESILKKYTSMPAARAEKIAKAVV